MAGTCGAIAVFLSTFWLFGAESDLSMFGLPLGVFVGGAVYGLRNFRREFGLFEQAFLLAIQLAPTFIFLLLVMATLGRLVAAVANMFVEIGGQLVNAANGVDDTPVSVCQSPLGCSTFGVDPILLLFLVLSWLTQLLGFRLAVLWRLRNVESG